jgi:membrane associated rhomboid family serine protease
MIFPIGDDQVKGGHFPLFSYAFLILNILVFIQQLRYPDMLVGAFGSIPAETLRGENLHTLVTSMFLHGSIMHIVGNMLFLWVFADNIEATIGNGRFLLFYLAGGLAAHIGHIYFSPNSIVPTIGASGAISAVLGAYLVMFPTSKVKLLFFIITFRVPAILFLGVWIWMQWTSGTAALETVDANTGGTAWWAHIGGFVFGVFAGLLFRMQFPPSRKKQEVAYDYYQ